MAEYMLAPDARLLCRSATWIRVTPAVSDAALTPVADQTCAFEARARQQRGRDRRRRPGGHGGACCARSGRGDRDEIDPAKLEWRASSGRPDGGVGETLPLDPRAGRWPGATLVLDCVGSDATLATMPRSRARGRRHVHRRRRWDTALHVQRTAVEREHHDPYGGRIASPKCSSWRASAISRRTWSIFRWSRSPTPTTGCARARSPARCDHAERLERAPAAGR